ncbi:hypothetical protein [Brachyspira sp.]|nr:hypothetical protein [Brachyspira sp.]
MILSIYLVSLLPHLGLPRTEPIIPPIIGFECLKNILPQIYFYKN